MPPPYPFDGIPYTRLKVRSARSLWLETGRAITWVAIHEELLWHDPEASDRLETLQASARQQLMLQLISQARGQTECVSRVCL